MILDNHEIFFLAAASTLRLVKKERGMQVGVIYDVVDRQHPAIEVGHFHNGRFFNAVKSPPFHDGDITGNVLRSRSGGGGTVLGTIEGLVMIRNGGGRVFDLIPRK